MTKMPRHILVLLVFVIPMVQGTSTPRGSQDSPQKYPALLPEGVARKSATTKIMPAYPEEAIRLGISGVVHVKFLTTPEGEVLRIKVKPRTHPLLSRAVANAVRLWKFKPRRPGLDSANKPFISRLIFRFDLHGGEPRVELYSPWPDNRIDECLGCTNSAREFREWREWDEIFIKRSEP